MGIPYTNVIAGYTNGTIITIDNSLELGEIAIALQEIAVTLAALNVNIQATFGPGAAAIPLTMANSAAISKNMLIQMAGGTDNIKNKQDQTSILLKGLTGAVDSMASALHEQAALTTLLAADQIEHNSFQKQATLDALARNDLPAPVPPPVMDTIKEKIVSVETIHAQALLTGSIASMTDNILSRLKNYILTSGPVVYAEEIMSEAWTKVTASVKNTISDFLPTSAKDVASKAQREAANTNIPSPKTPGTT